MKISETSCVYLVPLFSCSHIIIILFVCLSRGYQNIKARCVPCCMYTHNYCNTSLYDIIAYINYIIIRLRHSKRLRASRFVFRSRPLNPLYNIITYHNHTYICSIGQVHIILYHLQSTLRQSRNFYRQYNTLLWCGWSKAESLDESTYNKHSMENFQKNIHSLPPPPNYVSYIYMAILKDL